LPQWAQNASVLRYASLTMMHRITHFLHSLPYG
jgi:hypothetical protein